MLTKVEWSTARMCSSVWNDIVSTRKKEGRSLKIRYGIALNFIFKNTKNIFAFPLSQFLKFAKLKKILWLILFKICSLVAHSKQLPVKKHNCHIAYWLLAKVIALNSFYNSNLIIETRKK